MKSLSMSGWVQGTGVLAVLLLCPIEKSNAQGCVPAKGSGMSMTNMAAHSQNEGDESGGQFYATAAYRWLHSNRHFVGSEEQKERRHEGSEVINDSHYLDISASYAWNPRYSMTVSVPFVTHDRSSVLRRNNTERTIMHRYHTQSSGLGDLRVTTNMWVIDPKKPGRGNTLVGIGIELPTGKKDVQDDFDQLNAQGQVVKVRRNVDQSIQPGDGGYAILFDIYSYRQLSEKFSGFVNASYSLTPQETNGVLTNRANPYEAEMSIMDTYFARAGLEFRALPQQGVTFSLGTRIEGAPVHDLVGGSEGFRRPGYSISVEPGAVWARNDWTATLYAPVSIYRNRTRSVADVKLTNDTGIYRHGDAAFTDALVQFGFNKSF
jgi:hypothetical protein